MSDITAVDLAQALAEHAVQIDCGDTSYIGFLANPERVAERALETLARRDPSPEDDAEIAAMQAIVDALEPFGDLPPGPVERVLRWACDRYLVACASCGRP